ncbi:MAG TPA: rubrerythrin, partial [Ruminococcaceae bacterium]|nr:rubrerythrin [Oscillospiraceae bacterium]
MHYTTKEGQTKSSPYKWIALLRELFIEEISLLNQYQAHLANSLISEVNQVWQHILQDERTHYGELLCLLRQYDKEQAAACQQFAKQLPHIPSAGQPYCPAYAQQLLVNHIR